MVKVKFKIQTFVFWDFWWQKSTYESVVPFAITFENRVGLKWQASTITEEPGIYLHIHLNGVFLSPKQLENTKNSLMSFKNRIVRTVILILYSKKICVGIKCKKSASCFSQKRMRCLSAWACLDLKSTTSAPYVLA